MSSTISKKCENCPYPKACKYGSFALLAFLAYKTVAIIPTAYRYISKRLYKQSPPVVTQVETTSETIVETTSQNTEINTDVKTEIESTL